LGEKKKKETPKGFGLKEYEKKSLKKIAANGKVLRKEKGTGTYPGGQWVRKNQKKKQAGTTLSGTLSRGGW